MKQGEVCRMKRRWEKEGKIVEVEFIYFIRSKEYVLACV